MDLGFVKKILFTEEEITRRVRDLGEEITLFCRENLEGEELAIVTILKGGFLFLADLIRNIEYPLTIDFMSISSYEEDRAGAGIVKLTMDLSTSIKSKHVLIVEDIIDTGLTLGYIIRVLSEKGPKSIRICTLLDKAPNRIADLPIQFRGFEIENYFVVGYGLDYRQRWRNLPFICTLKDEVLTGEEGLD
jgi:hypoxanthine phosphoribosyltransferase